MAFNFSPKVVTDNLVMYLDAASPRSYVSGSTTWTDLSRGGNNGMLTNGPTYNPNNGGSIVFDGVDDYFITPSGLTPTLNITSQITLDIQIKSTALASVSSGDGLLCKGISTDLNSGVYELGLLQSGGTNYPYFRMRIGSSTPTYSPTNIPINLNQIYNIVCTYNGSIIRLYINGQESGSGLSASGLIQNNTQPLTIGVRYVHTIFGGFDSFFSGNIYLSKIYNRALSATEVLQNYNTTKSRFGLQ
jgi:hypothetical protein